MEENNYYEILGVSVTATVEEITAAKNTLAKRFHPDANLRNGIDTTRQMQEILEAYRVLSDPDRRADYDRKLKGRHSVMQTFDLRESADAGEDGGETGFVTYWKSANDLYDIICESDLLFKEHHRSPRLAKLSMDAIRHVLTLRGAQIPERYWHPDIMNWLLSGRVFRFTGISIFPKMKTGSISLSSSDMGLAANWGNAGTGCLNS